MTVQIPRDRLGVQIHCLRAQVASDFVGTLGRLRRLGIRNLELCVFPGFAGNPWGDFGAAAKLPARVVDERLREFGFRCVATHCQHRDLAPDRLDQTIAWALDAGSPALVLAGFPASSAASRTAWRKNFEWLNVTGRKIGDAGLVFAYHTQNELWQLIDGALLVNEMFRLVNPAQCLIELDPSGSLVHGTDWVPPVLQHPHRYLAFHLRDGRRPQAPVPWLPALPLGDGDMEWRRTLETCKEAGVPDFLLEMEVEDPKRVFAAIKSSLAHLESIGVLGQNNGP